MTLNDEEAFFLRIFSIFLLNHDFWSNIDADIKQFADKICYKSPGFFSKFYFLGNILPKSFDCSSMNFVSAANLRLRSLFGI